jgi:hypothetical protein
MRSTLFAPRVAAFRLHVCQARQIRARVSGRDKSSIVGYHTRSRSLRSELVAHLLDLRRSCFEGCFKSRHRGFLVLIYFGLFPAVCFLRLRQ